jgi:hypothetical protein
MNLLIRNFVDELTENVHSTLPYFTTSYLGRSVEGTIHQWHHVLVFFVQNFEYRKPDLKLFFYFLNEVVYLFV